MHSVCDELGIGISPFERFVEFMDVNAATLDSKDAHKLMLDGFPVLPRLLEVTYKQDNRTWGHVVLARFFERNLNNKVQFTYGDVEAAYNRVVLNKCLDPRRE